MINLDNLATDLESLSDECELMSYSGIPFDDMLYQQLQDRLIDGQLMFKYLTGDYHTFETLELPDRSLLFEEHRRVA